MPSAGFVPAIPTVKRSKTRLSLHSHRYRNTNILVMQIFHIGFENRLAEVLSLLLTGLAV
jgi:hypothetical protein